MATCLVNNTKSPVVVPYKAEEVEEEVRYARTVDGQLLEVRDKAKRRVVTGQVFVPGATKTDGPGILVLTPEQEKRVDMTAAKRFLTVEKRAD